MQDRVDKILKDFNSQVAEDLEKANKNKVDTITDKEQLGNLVIKHVRSKTG